jgi:hypothetical protein
MAPVVWVLIVIKALLLSIIIPSELLAAFDTLRKEPVLS